MKATIKLQRLNSGPVLYGNSKMELKKKNQYNRIIVRMPNWLGDAVMGTSILEDIKRALPNAHLSVLGHQGIQSLLESNPHIDEFIAFARDKKTDSNEKRRIYNTLSKNNYDAGILLTRSFSSAWWFYRGNVRERIGFKDHFRSPLLTHALNVPENEETEHQVITYKRLLAPLGIGITNTKPKLYIAQEALDAAKALLQTFGINEKHTLIGINPGAALDLPSAGFLKGFRS